MRILEQLEKGFTLLQLKKPKKARQIFEEVIANDPNFSLSYTLLSYCYLYESNYKDAFKFAEIALELDAHNAENHYLKGVALKGMNDIDHAIQYIESAIELGPENDTYYLELAKVYAKKELIGKAFTFVKKAIEINPNNPNAYALLSYLEEKYKGKKGASDEYLQKGLEIDPQNQILKQLRIDKAVSQADSDISITLSEQLLTENPSDFGIRQQVIDSHLSTFLVYRWLVLKYRAFNETNYLSIIFSLAFILIFGLLLRYKNAQEPYYNSLRILSGSIALWTSIFWFVRCIGQTYMKKKLWSFKIKQLLNAEFLVHFNMAFSTLSFFIFSVTTQAYWFGYAFFLCLLSLWSLPLLIQENKRTSFYYKIYLITVYAFGILLFFLHYNDSSYYDQISNLFAFVLFVPMLGSLIISSMIDSYKDHKNAKSSKSIKQKEKPKEKSTLIEKLSMWSVFPLFLMIQITSLILGANIFDTFKFLIIWSVIALICLLGSFLILKKFNSPMLNIISDTRTAEEQLNRIALRGISIILIVFIIGICTTAFFPYGKETWHQLKIEQHGLELKDRKTKVILRKENGWKVNLKPRGNAFYESEFKDCLRVKLKNSFLGVRYATEFEQCPDKIE